MGMWGWGPRLGLCYLCYPCVSATQQPPALPSTELDAAPPESQRQTSIPWSQCSSGSIKPVSTAWPSRNQPLVPFLECSGFKLETDSRSGWKMKYCKFPAIFQLCGGCSANKKAAASWLGFSWHELCKAHTVGHFLCWALICLASPCGGSWGSPGLLSDPPAGSQPGPAKTSLVWGQALSQKQLSWSKQWSREKNNGKLRILLIGWKIPPQGQYPNTQVILENTKAPHTWQRDSGPQFAEIQALG